MKSPLPLLTAGTALLCVSGFLIYSHVETVEEARGFGAPLVAELTPLERRHDFLRQQMEVAELQTAMRAGSQEERINVYILPETSDLDRTILVFDLLRDALKAQGALSSMTPIEFGEAHEDPLHEGVMVQPFTVGFTVREDGLQMVLLLVRLAGALTVADALDPTELKLLLTTTEEENPTGITALEAFLSTDLMDYIRNRRAHEEQLQRSLAGPGFTDALSTVLGSSLLRDARRLLETDFGDALYSHNLWPLQFIDLGVVRIERGGSDGWVTVTIKLELFESQRTNP